MFPIYFVMGVVYVQMIQTIKSLIVILMIAWKKGAEE